MNRMLKSTQQKLNCSQNRCGAVMVEFALCLPVAMFITFGMIDMARANMLRNTAENAAYEGARHGIVPGSTAASAEAVSMNVMNAINALGATAVCTPSTITTATTQVTITVSVPVAPNLWAAKVAFGTAKITRTCTLTREVTNGL